MTSDTTTKESRRSALVKTIRVVAVLLVLAALIKELRTPAEERTWHGTLGFIPYDFRMPTLERIKSTLWDPDGSIIVGRVFGVGWTINLGAVVERAKSLRAAA